MAVALVDGGVDPVQGDDDARRLERLVRSLRVQGVARVTIFSRSSVVAWGSELSDTVGVEWSQGVFLEGSGGCLRGLRVGDDDAAVVVLPLALRPLPDLQAMLAAHREGQARLTLFSAPTVGAVAEDTACVLDPSILQNIPPAGYWDIAENLVPELTVLGETVRLLSLPCLVSQREGTRAAGGDSIDTALASYGTQLQRLDEVSEAEVWAHPESTVAPNARFSGRVLLLSHVSVPEGAVIVGPVVVSEECRMTPGCLIVGDQAARPRSVSEQGGGARVARETRIRLLAVGLVTASLLWSYRAVLREVWGIWMRSDEYSAGLLVPLLAVYVLWGRRRSLASCPIRPCLLGGGLGLLLAQGLRFFGLYAMYSSLERLSAIVCLASLTVWLGGWRLTRRVAGVLVFLLLMLPWPNRAQAMVSLPLQRWATASAVFSLETLGYPVVREGNVIQIGDTQVAVAEACNGLRMVTAFFVIGALVALLARRAWWEKLILFGSCLPIALLCNTIRLTVTSIAFTRISVEYWEKVFHDFGGYAMMPLALALVVLELGLLERLFVAEETGLRDIVVRSS